MRETTEGVPHAPASVMVMPHPSRADEEASTHALRYSSTSASGSTYPGRCSQPSAPAARRRASRAGRS